MLFTDLPLDHRLQSNIAKLNIDTLTDIQAQAIPKALLNNDILASSKTGSGKTLAFAIPMINRLLTQKALSRKDARALILAPTRELAKQVYLVVKQLVSSTGLQANLIIGGENYNDQAKKLKRAAHILVGTAGRVADHLNDKHLFLNGLELLILDEADRMLELGFYEQLNAINNLADHRKRQTFMFSATIAPAQLKKMTQALLKKPEKIIIDDAQTPHSDIQQRFYLSDNVNQKDSQLLKLIDLQDRQQAIVFTATRDDTLRLAEHLNNNGVSSVALHGEMLQKQRIQTMQDFSRGKYAVLTTTDLASRGLDIADVSQVINYDLPKIAEEYIHRIGRTGRAGKKGNAYSLVGHKDWLSYTTIKNDYLGETTFEEIEGISTKFKGLQPKRVTSTKKVKSQHSRAKPTQDQSKRKRRFNPMESKDIGHAPIKKSRKDDIQDDEK